MRNEQGKLTLSNDQIRGIASCVVALREVPEEDRIDCLVVLCKSLFEERLNYVLFPERLSPGRDGKEKT
jgi:hypothetical protein